jgi:hypothetical protein
MLNTRLQQVWDAATPSQREGALLAADHVLQNLVSYRPGTYLHDDREMQAAELLGWYQEGEAMVKARVLVALDGKAA